MQDNSNSNNVTAAPKKNWIRRHPVWSTLGAIVIGGIVAGSASGGSSAKAPVHRDGVSLPAITCPGNETLNNGKCTSFTPAPSLPSDPVLKATKVKFVITGNVPAAEYQNVDINYGANNDTHDVTIPSLEGTVTYTVPFKPGAEYYAADVMFDGTGSAKVKIVVTGPNMKPLTVSHGSATGHGEFAGGDASAQASPDDNHGTSWYDES